MFFIEWEPASASQTIFWNSRWAVGSSLAKVLCVCLSLYLLSTAWNTFSASFCRACISAGPGLMRAPYHPCSTNDQQWQGRYTDTQYRAGKGKQWPSDFAIEGTWIRGHWEPFNCFYLAWELICSDTQKCGEPCLHKRLLSAHYRNPSIFMSLIPRSVFWNLCFSWRKLNTTIQP